MGEDFIRKTEKSYRRSLQRTVERRFFPLPLFAQPETSTTAYPCRLLEPTNPISPEAQLLLLRRDDRTIDILAEHRVIGKVEGEPCQDLNTFLDEQPGSANMVRIHPLQTNGSYLDFTITAEDQQPR
jgi:hypothetical protein